MTKKLTIIVGGLVAVLIVVYSVFFSVEHGSEIDALIEKNIAAKGGKEAWNDLQSLRLSGQMELGKGVVVPYVIEQKRAEKMCLEYEFDNQTAIQCVNGVNGWQLLPFRGQKIAQAMSAEAAAQMADTASIDGLLFNSYRRGLKVELLGSELIAGRMANKLKVTMPAGTVRWLYLDEETGLEVKLESTRILRGKERLVETVYRNWKEQGGLLFPSRQETRTQGDIETQFITVETIVSNPVIDDERFNLPTYGRSGV